MFNKAPLAIALFCLPVIAGDFTTYIGNGDNLTVSAMTTDTSGNIYITGSRMSTSATDAFLTKLDATGKVLFTKIFGGAGPWIGTAVVVDSNGEIYVAGRPGSGDLLLSNALQTTPGGTFIVKLSNDGKTVLYSTYFGAGGATILRSIATDSAGDLYLTGSTFEPTFPVTTGIPASSLNFYRHGAFVTKIAAAGDRIVYSMLLAGATAPGLSAFTDGTGIAVDAQGNAYVGGNTNTTDLPTTPGTLAPKGSGAFVAKVDAAGNGLAYLTYLGNASTVNAIAVDASGDAYLSGATNDPHFPVTPNAFQTTLHGELTNAFAAKLSPDATHMVWATYIGGAGPDAATTIAIDSQGDAFLTGTTQSATFPNGNGWSTGGDFLVEVNPTGTALPYSGRYPNGTTSTGVAVGAIVDIVGPTGIVSAISPQQAPLTRPFGITNAAGGQISGRVSRGELISIYGPHIGPATPMIGNFDNNGALPVDLAGVEVLFNGAQAPLLYASDSQINAIVPPIDNAATINIVNQNASGLAVPIVVVDATPQVFRNADGSAAALNQDGSVNSYDNPAKAGTLVSIWTTGINDLALPAGQRVTTANNLCGSACVVNIIATVPTKAAVQYAGPAPAMPSGVMQINFQVPASNNHLVTFTVSTGTFVSDPVILYTTGQ